MAPQTEKSAQPFDYQHPVSGDHFVGYERNQQMNEIAARLSGPGGDSYVLIGGRHFGKSSFLVSLQKKLLHQCAGTQPGEWYPLPVLIDLKELQHASPEGVFALQLQALYNYFASPLLRKSLGLSLVFDVRQTHLAAFKQSTASVCTREQFADILEDLILTFSNDYGSLSPIFLMDEASTLLRYDWHKTFFDQLRSLVYVSKIQGYIRYILAGSSKLIEGPKGDSPLLQMLTVKDLRVLEDEAIEQMIGWAGPMSADLAQFVREQSGGHPFIAQYLLAHIWDDLQSGTRPAIAHIINGFHTEPSTSPVFTQWRDELGQTGQLVYNVLRKAPNELTLSNIAEHIPSEEHRLQIGSVLRNLCYHGLVQHDGTWTNYRPVGQLFQDWFCSEVLPSLAVHTGTASPARAPDPFPEITYRSQTDIPTAYWHTMKTEHFPLITCEIDNTGENCISNFFVVDVIIQGWSDIDAKTLRLAAGQKGSIRLLPRIERAKLADLTEIYPAQCLLRVQQRTENGLALIFYVTIDLTIYSVNTALLAIVKEKQVQPLTNYLAVFVTPNHPKIQRFVGTVAARHKQIFYGAVTGQKNAQEARTILRDIAKKIFMMLKEKAYLSYVPSAQSFGTDSHQIAQRVRLPWQSLPEESGQYGQAYCLDGALLFASLLENIMIEPLIVLVPHHAFVGWHILPEVNAYDFLDLTMLDSTFEVALQSGNKIYDDAYKSGVQNNEFLDPAGFFHIVDIAICRRKYKIFPLP
jgi:hypothetical protein